MREKIIYILKHNVALQTIYRLVFSTVFKIIGKFVSTDENLVIFLSMMGTRYNDSPRSIYEYIRDNEEYKDIRCVWALEHPEEYPELDAVKIDSLKFFILALKAKYWVASTHFERGLSFKKKNTRYLYTCHGTAIKLCGNDCPGRKDFDYSNVDILCVASEYDKMVMQRSFKARPESFLECGRPCNDRLWHTKPEDKELMKEKLCIPKDKTVILYAPTWRDSVDGGASYQLHIPIDFAQWEKTLGDKYVVLFRAHQITNKIMGIKFNDFIKDVSLYPEVNDLMIASDILISDYSAMLTDYAILERPILCFAYDYDEYLKKRGTYFELDEKLPNKSCRTEEELLERILNLDYSRECENTAKFKAYFDQYGGNATAESTHELFKYRTSEKNR